MNEEEVREFKVNKKVTNEFEVNSFTTMNSALCSSRSSLILSFRSTLCPSGVFTLFRREMDHTATPRRSRHAQSKRQACQLYSSPSALSTLPVYEEINITWDPVCLTTLPAQVDLFLSVQEPDGLVACHVWTGVEYATGTLATQLSPAWWNASTGAGSVSAQVRLRRGERGTGANSSRWQFTITPTGSPIWDTSAPAGPAFSIAYNGTCVRSLALLSPS